uniref:Uncharacterized protein n=1 Tax=Catharus ustulatus TaxID=91951 RepID=A0A8C3TUX5_CATUS
MPAVPSGIGSLEGDHSMPQELKPLWGKWPSQWCDHSLWLVTKLKSGPVLSAFDKALSPERALCCSPHDQNTLMAFLGWGAMAHSGRCCSPGHSCTDSSAGATSQSPTAEVMSCPSSAGAFLISWLCQVLRAPCAATSVA